jgi:hypothetical protein
MIKSPIRWWQRNAASRSRLVIYLISNALVFTLGVIFLVVGGVVAAAIGSGLMATGIAGGVLVSYVVLSEDLVQRYEVVNKFGIRGIFKGRSVSMREDYESRLDSARHEIDLLGFGQRAFRQDFGLSFESWVSRGVAIRVLLLDPQFPTDTWKVSTQRDAEENNSEGDIGREVKAFLEATRELRGQSQNFEVRLYRALPSINILRIDDELFWGPYLMGKPSRNSPTILVGRGFVYDTMAEHFNAIWSDPSLSVAVDNVDPS